MMHTHTPPVAASDMEQGLNASRCTLFHSFRQKGSERVQDLQSLIADGALMKPRTDQAMLAPVLASCLALQVQQREKQETCRAEGFVDDTNFALHSAPSDNSRTHL